MHFLTALLYHRGGHLLLLFLPPQWLTRLSSTPKMAIVFLLSDCTKLPRWLETSAPLVLQEECGRKYGIFCEREMMKASASDNSHFPSQFLPLVSPLASHIAIYLADSKEAMHNTFDCLSNLLTSVDRCGIHVIPFFSLPLFPTS